jgi:hypothetical protein
MSKALDTHTIYGRIAREKQREVKLLVFTVLASGVAVSLVSALSVVIPSTLSYLVFYMLIPLFMIGIAAQLGIWTWHVEDRWFQARAVAETSKSLAWEFMMGSKRILSRELFGKGFIMGDKNGESKNVRSAETELVRVLKDMRGEFKESLYPDWDKASVESEISDEMRTMRSLDPSERKSIYLARRLDDQIEWYGKKAKSNKKMKGYFASLAIALEAVGLGIAIYAIIFDVVPAEGMMALIATMVSSLVGWSQSRRYAELVEPYLYTSDTLKELRERFTRVANEDELVELVEESEHTISREHQMWQIRRGVTPRKHLQDTS